MFVYVRNQNGHSLMPCAPAKARKLLKAGKARVIGYSPFTIQLQWLCEEKVQEVALGIDKGSYFTGFCCVGKGHILLSGEIQHRQDVKDKMESRAATGETAGIGSGTAQKGFLTERQASGAGGFRLPSKPLWRR